MLQEHDVQYNHSMIILARESRGISQSELSKLLGFSQGKLSKVENGILALSLEELEKISITLGYPTAFFQKNENIYGMGLSEFFHRKKQTVPQKSLNKIYARLEKRRMEIQVLLKSIDFGETNFPHIDPDRYDGDVEKIAQLMRVTWRVPKGPIQNVVNLIEDAGGIIVPFDFEGAQIDAITLWHPGTPPLIFTNFDRPPDRIRFTLCHEVGHLIMHRTPPSEYQDIEQQADQFASEFLMPREDVSHTLKDLTLQKLAALKPHWKVSMGALLKKAADLGIISERQSRYLWMQMGKLGYRTKEPAELAPPIEKPWILDDILNVYQNDLKYSISDLSTAVHLSESEFSTQYRTQSKIQHLRIVR